MLRVQVHDSWRVAARMGEVPGSYVAAALLPAFIITVLFYFGALAAAQLLLKDCCIFDIADCQLHACCALLLTL